MPNMIFLHFLGYVKIWTPMTLYEFSFAHAYNCISQWWCKQFM